MIIDIFAHFITKKLIDVFEKRVGNLEIVGMRPDWPFEPKTTCDADLRVGILDRYPGMVQVLTPTGQPIENFASVKDTIYLTKLYNDEMAELVNKYPKKFIAAIAILPVNDVKACVKEIDRVITELGFKGILLYTPSYNKPLDAPEFLPIYERMAHYRLPVWIHPTRHVSFGDYAGEKASRFGLYHAFGWPYETSIAMCRIVCAGLMRKYKNLKFITHHAGAMIPFFAGRISQVNPSQGKSGPADEAANDKNYLIKQMQKFYNDTAINGCAPALMCSYAFFGADHLLFGSDMPYGPGLGEFYLKSNLEAVESMKITTAEKKKILEKNAKKLLSLDGK